MQRRLLELSIGTPILALAPLGPAGAQETASSCQEPSTSEPKPAARADDNHLPADSTTLHALEVDGRAPRFQATAGSIRLTDDKEAPQADVAFVAYQLAGADPAKRPLTFAINGGPGAA